MHVSPTIFVSGTDRSRQPVARYRSAARPGTWWPIAVFCVAALLWVAAGFAIEPASAEEAASSGTGSTGAAAPPGTGWRIDFGPYAGYYDFDSTTQFEDGGMAGLRLGIHRDSWFRFETEFDEVYTRREPAHNAARQITLAVHGRFEPQWWRLAPSGLLGLGFVMLDDSELPDAFGEAYDMGLGLAYRVSSSWRLRADFMMRYQRFQIRDPGLPVDDPAARSEPVGLWARSIRIGAFYDFPAERDEQPVRYPVELGLYAGYWNFNSVYRYQDDAVFGLRGGVGLFSWMSLQVELDQITTSNKRTNEWAQTISFAMHGLFEARAGARWRPGVLVGVAFMGLDNQLDFDGVSEGFDVGPSLRLRSSERISLQGDVLLRYQSVRVNTFNQDGTPAFDDAIDYVWSYGIRLGVNIAL